MSQQKARDRQWLRTALEVTRLLTGEVDRRDALRIVTGHLREVSGADYAAIVSVDPAAPDTTAFIAAIDGLGMEHAAYRRIPLVGITAMVAKCGVPVVSEAITLEEGFDPPEVVADAMSTLGLGMYLPLAVPGKVMGVLIVGWQRGSPYAETSLEEQECIGLFASTAAVALEQLQSRILIAQERDRIATELRDDVIDRLYAIGTHLHTASDLAARPEAQQRIHEAIDELDETAQKVRDAIFALRQQASAARPLATSQLLDEIDAARTALGFTPRLVVHGPVDRPLSPEVQAALVQGIRMALTDAASHASPTSVEVTVEMTDSQLTFTVTDDGHLIKQDPSGVPVELHESAQRLGGWCRVRTQGPDKTTLEWHVPHTS